MALSQPMKTTEPDRSPPACRTGEPCHHSLSARITEELGHPIYSQAHPVVSSIFVWCKAEMNRPKFPYPMNEMTSRFSGQGYPFGKSTTNPNLKFNNKVKYFKHASHVVAHMKQLNDPLYNKFVKPCQKTKPKRASPF